MVNAGQLEFLTYEYLRILRREDGFNGPDFGSGAESLKPRIDSVLAEIATVIPENERGPFEDVWSQAREFVDWRNVINHSPLVLTSDGAAHLIDMKSSDTPIKNKITIEGINQAVDICSGLVKALNELRHKLIELVK